MKLSPTCERALVKIFNLKLIKPFTVYSRLQEIQGIDKRVKHHRQEATGQIQNTGHLLKKKKKRRKPRVFIEVYQEKGGSNRCKEIQQMQ